MQRSETNVQAAADHHTKDRVMAEFCGMTSRRVRDPGSKGAGDRLFQSSQGIEGHSSVHEGLDPRNGKATLGQQRELPGVARGSTTGKQINTSP